MKQDTTELFKAIEVKVHPSNDRLFSLFMNDEFVLCSSNERRAKMRGYMIACGNDLLEKGFKPIENAAENLLQWWFNPKAGKHATVYGAEYHILENSIDAAYRFGQSLRHFLESENKFQ